MSKQTEALKLALNKAFQLGQRYWSWADSEYSSHWKKADAAKAEFDQLVQDTINAALAEQSAPMQELEEYDAGLLAAAGGGDVEWWWDYIRAELGRAYEHYQSQMPVPLAHCEAGPEYCQQCKAEQPAQQEPVAWPAGLIERITAAEQRIQDGHAPRRIPADPTDVDLVLAEVRYLLEGKQPPFWVSTSPPAQQEPVAVRLWDSQWVNVVNHDNCYRDWSKEDAINHAVKMTEKYIAGNVADNKLPPAQRTWIGLTDEAIWLEYQRFWPFHPAEEPTLAKDIVKFASAIEAKLKEKNT